MRYWIAPRSWTETDFVMRSRGIPVDIMRVLMKMTFPVRLSQVWILV